MTRDPRLHDVTHFYDFHPISAQQILAAVQARGISHADITEEVLQHHDQDHYGGTAAVDPVFDGRTMVWAGHPDHKFVGYPIRDLATGKQLFNFIAEFRTTDLQLTEREDWNQPGVLSDFIDRFDAWRFDWLDIPALIRAAPGTYRFPMVDRDPLPQWTFGRTTLLGDAAHPIYPIGSNGASQAILDARVLTGCLRAFPDDVDMRSSDTMKSGALPRPMRCSRIVTLAPKCR